VRHARAQAAAGHGEGSPWLCDLKLKSDRLRFGVGPRVQRAAPDLMLGARISGPAP
jgi:hypothetical protein